MGDKNVTTTRDKNVTSFVVYLITKLPSFLDLLSLFFFLDSIDLIQERKQNLRMSWFNLIEFLHDSYLLSK